MSEGGAFLAGSIIGKLVLDKMGWNSAVADVKKDEAALTSHAAKIGKGFSDTGKAMSVAGAAVVGSLVAMAKATADTAEKFLVMSKKTGVSVETLSAFDYAAKVTDSSIEDISQGFKKMSMNMDAMRAGTGPSGAAIAVLGINLNDSTGKLKGMDEIMLDVAEKFSTMPDGAQKAALAIDLFGKAGANLIPFLNEGKENIAALTAEAEKFGIVMSRDDALAADEFGDQLVALEKGAKGVGQQLAMTIMPALTDLVLKMKDVVMGITGWMKEHPELTRVITNTALAVGAIMMVGGPLLILVSQLITSVGVLKAAFAGLNPMTIAGGLAVGILVVELVKLVSIITEAKRAIDYSTEANDRLIEGNIKLDNKMYELVKTGKLAIGKYYEMKDAAIAAAGGLDDYAATMANWISHGKYGVQLEQDFADVGKAHAKQLEEEAKKLAAAQLALENKAKAIADAKAAQEAYTGFLGTLGIYTEEQHALKLIEVNKAEAEILKRFTEGKISAEIFTGAIAALTADADKFNISLTTTAGASAATMNALKRLKTEGWDANQESIVDVIGKIQGLVPATDEVIPTMADFTSDTVENFEGVGASIIDASDVMGFSWSKAIKTVEPKLSAFAQSFADMVTEMARGWSVAFIDMFGLADKLIGESTKHNQDYFDKAKGAVAGDLEIKKAALKSEYDAKKAEIEKNITDEDMRKAALLQAETQYQADLAALDEWGASEEKRIQGDEDKSRDEHAQNELDRQNSLWTKVKGVFGDALEKMLATWITGFATKILNNIATKILPSIASIGTEAVTAASTAGGAVTGLVSSVGGVIAGLIGAVATGITTIAGAIAGAIVALATGISTAAAILAAAAPALLIVGGIALGLFAGFKLLGGLLGGGGGSDPNTFWLKLISDNMKQTRDWVGEIWQFALSEQWAVLQHIDVYAVLISDILRDTNIYLNDIREGIGGMREVLDNLKGAAAGAVATDTQLMVVHGTPAAPEYIVPSSRMAEIVTSAKFDGSQGGPGTSGQPANLTVNIRPIVINKGDKWFIDFIQENLDGGGLTVPLAAVHG